jgi:hypothetical protein
MKIKVHRNLHKACWSIRGLAEKTTHREWCLISSAEFRVSQAARAKVLANKVRSVHAYAAGEYHEHNIAASGEWLRVSYNPYRAGAFLLADGREVWSARFARFNRLGQCEVIL